MSESTKPKPFCFVLMPFVDSFDDIYKLGIKEACNEAGAYCERVDEQIFQERILDRIYNQIAKADVIIADLTGKNPNVFYEVGYAHALGKSAILLTQNVDDIPFDFKHFPHIIYQNKITFLKEELAKRVKWSIESPNDKVEEKLAVEIYVGKQNLSKPSIIKARTDAFSISWDCDLPLTIFNNSTITFKSGDFKIGVITSSNLSSYSGRGLNFIQLPDGSKLIMLPDFDTIFPSLYSSYNLFLSYSDVNEFEPVTVRVFSSTGTRDYDINIQF